MPQLAKAIVLAAALLAAPFASAEKITFVTTAFPPYVIEQSPQLSGFSVEMVQELCRKVGAEAEFTVVPWNRALEYVKAGKVDGILMPVYSRERAEYMLFAEPPIGSERISIMALHGARIAAKSLAELKDARIGVVLGYSYGKEFDENSQLRKDVSRDNGMLLKRLNLGRHDLVASDEYVVNYLARKSGQPVLEPLLNLADNPKYLAFSKAIGPRGEELAKRFSEAIREAQRDGTMERVQKKYFMK